VFAVYKTDRSHFSIESRQAATRTKQIWWSLVVSWVFIILAAGSLALMGSVRVNAQAFPCKSSGDCDFWVAAQGPGDPSSYFKKGTRRAQAKEIQVGDILFATTDTNVRLTPPRAGWDPNDILFQLSDGQAVQVLEQRIISGGGGQLWLRISRPTVGTAPVNLSFSAVSNTPPAPGPCLQLPDQNSTGMVPIISPPVNSIPPSTADLNRLLQGREIFCDQYGLIVHKHADGTFDGGDTAAREGWYWLGVWIRQNTPGLEPWKPQRKLKSFDQVLALLEPNGDGIFYRHPKQPPYNNPFSKDWGTSRDQLVPLIAAMGVWGKYDQIRRLWEALPEDIQGKHAFNGNWRNALGQDGPNCSQLKHVNCGGDDLPCPTETDLTPCPADTDQTPCSSTTNTTACGDNDVCVLKRPWDGGCAQTVKVHDYACEAAKGTGNAATKLSCEVKKGAGNASAKANCEATKALNNVSQKAACEAQKEASKKECEIKKWADYNLCRFTNIFNGDLIGPATVNLFRRALNQNPIALDLADALPFTLIPGEGVSKGGIDGELELLTNSHLIVGKANDDHDYVDPDINHIVNLLMARLRYPTFVSDNATSVYMNQRAPSYGSYLGPYYTRYGDDMLDFKTRIVAGVASGWRADVSPVMGAVRWYHRPDTDDGHANPQLATLYSVIVDRLLK
jgi:hypothetical protein